MSCKAASLGCTKTAAGKPVIRITHPYTDSLFASCLHNEKSAVWMLYVAAFKLDVDTVSHPKLDTSIYV